MTIQQLPVRAVCGSSACGNGTTRYNASHPAAHHKTTAPNSWQCLQHHNHDISTAERAAHACENMSIWNNASLAHGKRALSSHPKPRFSMRFFSITFSNQNAVYIFLLPSTSHMTHSAPSTYEWLQTMFPHQHYWPSFIPLQNNSQTCISVHSNIYIIKSKWKYKTFWSKW